jgi:hypothetical protein
MPRNSAALSEIVSRMPGDITGSHKWLEPLICNPATHPKHSDLSEARNVYYNNKVKKSSFETFDPAATYVSGGPLYYVYYNGKLWVEYNWIGGDIPGENGWTEVELGAIQGHDKVCDKLILQNLGNSVLKISVNKQAQANSYHFELSAATDYETGDGGSYIFYPRRENINLISVLPVTAANFKIGLTRIIGNSEMN